MSDHTDASIEGWAIVELMGHRRLAGRVSEQRVAGAAFLRVDVPGEGDDVVITQLYSAGAVYALTPTTEETARAAARALVPGGPVHRWELTPGGQLADVADDAW